MPNNNALGSSTKSMYWEFNCWKHLWGIDQ